MGWFERKDQFTELQKRAELAGGIERIEKEHKKGKYTARERIRFLFDNHDFHEIGMLAKSRIEFSEANKKHYLGDGVITAYGTIHGVTVYVAAQDATISGGAGGEEHIKKVCHVLELAIKTQSPFIWLCDSGGARIEEGILSLAAYSRLFYLNTLASGRIPQIAAIMGNCAGGSSYSPALCDFTFMVEKTSQFFLTGPKVIKALTGEEVTMNDLGGAGIHEQTSGQIHLVCQSDEECLMNIRKLIFYIKVRQVETTDNAKKKSDTKKIENIVPENPRYSDDVKEVMDCIIDENSFFEMAPKFAANIITGFGRLEGKTIGIVANQPCIYGGALNCDAADKASRFVRFCDCFDIPLLVLVDVPGFYPGLQEEKKGVLRHGSKLLYAFAEAEVPRITVLMRKAYGGAYCAMNSKDLGADFVFAWPICEVAVMGADGAVDVIFHKEISKSDDPDEARNDWIRQYEEKYLNPYYAASYSIIDEVILPEDTRERLITAFKALENKQIKQPEKKHGNIPL